MNKKAIVEFLNKKKTKQAYAIGTVKVVTEINGNSSYYELFKDCYYEIDSSGLIIYTPIGEGTVIPARVANFKKYEYVMMVDYEQTK